MNYYIVRGIFGLGSLGVITSAVLVFIAIWTVDPNIQERLFITAVVAFFISIGLVFLAGPALEDTAKPKKVKDNY